METARIFALICPQQTLDTMPAGYSGTPLLQKLGIKPGVKILLVDPPEDYQNLLETDISSQLCKKNEVPDLVHLFAKTNKAYEAAMKKLQPLATKNPAIVVWVSWYKKSAKIPTDLTEDVIRAYALKHDWVDVKVCAVSDIWSGLKLVVPLVSRKAAK